MFYFARVLLLVAGLFSLPVQATVVVTSIPPLAMVAESLLVGTGGEVVCLIDGKQSPHGMSLLPSQRVALAKADLVLWVGADFESWLVKPLNQIHRPTLAMADTEGVRFLPAMALSHANNHEADEHHGAWDLHLWLDPSIMQTYVRYVRDELIMRDPKQALRYQENSDRLLVAVQQADAQARQLLLPMQQEPLLVMHDAWRYYFRHYGLTQGAMVQKTPEQSLGAASIAELERQLRQGRLRCLLREPQIEPKAMGWLYALAPNLQVAMTDPLGQPHYEGGYPAWLLDQAKAIQNCSKKP